MKNLHLQHVEDLLVTQPNATLPVNVLQEVVRCLLREPSTVSDLTVKWDGAPSFVCGPHPENGKFFIGTKSVFAGKVNQSHEDIDRNHDNHGLRAKLHEMFNNFRDLKWTAITQGDLLWWPENFSDNTFRANTLIYKFPWSMVVGKVLREAWYGAVLHTTYVGNDFKTMEAKFGAQVPNNTRNHNVCMFEPKANLPISNVIGLEFGIHTVIPREFSFGYMEPNSIRRQYKTLNVLRQPKYRDVFLRYVNSEIKKESTGIIHNPYAQGFLDFYAVDVHTRQLKLKTKKGKDRLVQEILTLHDLIDYTELVWIFSYYVALRNIKTELIKVLDSQKGDVKIFLPNGEECGHEGYVVHLDNNVSCKFVDRFIFSKANFETVKAWQ